MLDNYDYDQDKKITQFDLAQIIELDLRHIDDIDNAIDLSGLENCISLKTLKIGNCSNYDILTQMPVLESITIENMQNINQLNELTKIQNLKN